MFVLFHSTWRLIVLVMVFLMAGFLSMAQLTVIQGLEMNLNPEQLIRNHIIGNGVSVSNATLNGMSGLIARNHIGYFQAVAGARDQLQMGEGILLTTGKADNAIGPNNASAVGLQTFSGNDPDLEELNGRQVFDACVLEFDFIPQCDTISFRYAFGSEEFYEFCGKDFNDLFGFFLSGPGIEGPFSNGSINIARMPNGVSLVSINNLCLDPSVLWNNENGEYLQYNAVTHVITAWHKVIQYQTYHIKMAIGDDLDAFYDSGVFIEMGSFSAGFDFEVENSALNQSAGVNAVEGCNSVAVSFLLSAPALNESRIDFTIGGSATIGKDFNEIPDFVTFHPGEDSVSVIIDPLPDTMTEGNETVVLKIRKYNCSGLSMVHDTIFICDNSTLSMSAGDDLTICPGDTIRIVADVTGGFRPYQWFWNQMPENDSIFIVVPDSEENVYEVEVKDNCGVVISDTLIINVNRTAFLANQPASKEICDGNPTGILLQSNISLASFSWDPVLASGQVTGYESGFGEKIDQVLILNSDDPGVLSYNIRITAYGCDTTWASFKVSVNPLPKINLGEDNYIIAGSSFELNAGPGFSEYHWSTGQKDSVIKVKEAGSYWVTVKNNNSCIDSDTIVLNEFGLYIPNAFTPDGDGLNDVFRIQGFTQETEARLQIFDRWGGMVFETSLPGNGWEGNCKTGPCNEGTYVWIIQIIKKKRKVFSGTILLIR